MFFGVFFKSVEKHFLHQFEVFDQSDYCNISRGSDVYISSMQMLDFFHFVWNLQDRNIMASNIDWDVIMRDRFTTFKLEENTFVESLKICNSNEVAAERIYDAIKDDSDIPENLKLMYREAVFGENEAVKRRIKNRITNMRRNHKYDFSVNLIMNFSN